MPSWTFYLPDLSVPWPLLFQLYCPLSHLSHLFSQSFLRPYNYEYLQPFHKSSFPTVQFTPSNLDPNSCLTPPESAIHWFYHHFAIPHGSLFPLQIPWPIILIISGIHLWLHCTSHYHTHLEKKIKIWWSSNLLLPLVCTYQVECGWRKMTDDCSHFKFMITNLKCIFHVARQSYYTSPVHSLSHAII